MKSPKKRNKAYSPAKSLRNNFAYLMRDSKECIIAGTFFNKVTYFINTESKQLLAIGNKTIATLEYVPHFWYFTLFLLCRDQQGKEYIRYWYPEFVDSNSKTVITNRQPLYYREATELMYVEHQKLLKTGANPLHILAAGRLIAPYPKRFEPEEIDSICTANGFWDRKTKWEIEHAR